MRVGVGAKLFDFDSHYGMPNFIAHEVWLQVKA